MMHLRTAIQYLLSNPVRKIFAIIFAFGLWFFVAIDNNYVYEKSIEVLYTNLPDAFIIVDSVAEINVIFTGRGGSLLSTWTRSPKARCDLSNARNGENKIPMKRLAIPMGFSDVTTSFNTASITVTVDKKITKEVEISVPFKGSPKEGYAVSDIGPLDTVTVIGPRKLLLNLEEVVTETLNVRNKSSSFIDEVEIEESSPLFQFSKKKVRVGVSIDTIVDRLFTNIPLMLIFSPSQRVSSEKINLDTLVVEGPASRMPGLKKRDIRVQIKLTNLLQGEYNLPATIILPQYITPVYSNPKKFNIKIY